MRRSLAACVTLLLGCNPAQPEADPGKRPAAEAPAAPAKTDAPKPDAPPKTEAPKPDAPPKTETPAEPETPPPTKPAEPEAAPLPPATVALLDRLVPAAERVTVDDAAAKALQIRVIERELWVTDGTRQASLERRASAVTGVTTVHDAGGEPVLRVVFEDDVGCVEGPHHVEHSARTLLARLETAAAATPHAKRDFEASSRGYAQAALLDSSLDDAWLGLARAQAKRGDAASAMAALGPLLGRAKLATYHAVASDPELASLREQKEITALKAPAAGNAEIRTLTIAHSAHHSLVALRRTEQSWGACNYVEDLRLFDTAKGELVLTLPLVGWLDTDPECNDEGEGGGILPRRKKEVNQRLDAAERFLRDMGFSVSAGLELVDARKGVSPDDLPVTQVKLPTAGLEIAASDAGIQVRKGGEVVATEPQSKVQGISRAGHDPDARVVFLDWYQEVPEGCASDEDGTGFLVIPLPASP